MRVSEIVIHNFRSVIHQRLRLDGYSLLIGHNNSGKTNVIDAIRAFYEKDKFKYDKGRDKPHKGASGDDAWVDLEFALEPSEYDSLPDVYKWKVNSLRVRKYFHVASGPKKSGEVYGFTAENVISDEPFHGAKGVGKGKLGTLIYVPAVSKLDDHTKMTGPSALRDLVQDILDGTAESSPSLAGVQDQFASLAETIKDEVDGEGRSLGKIEEELSSALASWGAKFKLDVKAPSPELILKNLVEHSLIDVETERELNPSQFGSGLQRHLIYSLIQLRARLTGGKKPSKKKEFSPEFTFLLFEEPEAFLHPSQQRMLHHELQTLVSGNSCYQVLCSSHSAQFVSTELMNLKSIARLQRTNGQTSLFQISDAALDDIAKESDEVKKIRGDDTSVAVSADDEAIFYFLQLDPRRASMFYCDHVLLVEGPTDRAIVEWLRDHGELSIGQRTLEVVDCIGKFNVHRFMRLCSALGVRFSVVIDEDGDKKGNQLKIHQELNQFLGSLKKVTNCVEITEVKPNVEVMLGLPTDSNSNKPLVALKALKNGTVEAGKLKTLIALLNGNLQLA